MMYCAWFERRARPCGPGAFGVQAGISPFRSSFFAEFSALVTLAAVIWGIFAVSVWRTCVASQPFIVMSEVRPTLALPSPAAFSAAISFTYCFISGLLEVIGGKVAAISTFFAAGPRLFA